MKRMSLLFFTTMAVVILSGAVSYGFSIYLNPPTIKETIAPGGTISGTITVRNDSDKDVAMKAYVEDWTYDATGAKVFQDPGTTPFSCAKNISIFPKKFRIDPKSNFGVQYNITMPEDAKGGYNAVIFFESIPTDESFSGEGLMVKLAGRLGSILHAEIEGTVDRKGKVESLSITPPQSNKPLEMNLSFKNTGNVHIDAKGTLNIIDKDGNVYGKKNFGPFYTMPGDTRNVIAEWYGELEEGTYDAIITIDIASEEGPIVEERKIDVFFGGAISALKVDATAQNQTFSVLVENKGHLNIDTGGRIDISDAGGEVVKSVSLKKTIVAPGKEKELKGTLKENLSPGTYTAKAFISIGTAELTKEETFVIR